MHPTPARIALSLVAIAAMAAAVACGGDDGAPATATPNLAATAEVAGAAERPAWFPKTFPLPANTVVVSQEQQGEGGTVQFRAPVAFSRAIEIFDKNWESHEYTPLERDVSETGATYKIENKDFTSDVTVSASGGESLIDVILTKK